MKDKKIMLGEKNYTEVTLVVPGEKPKTMYMSRERRLFNAPETADYDSATHRKCECGAIIKREYTRCEACNDKMFREKYMQYPQKKWDGEMMFYSHFFDEYFQNEEDFAYHVEYHAGRKFPEKYGMIDPEEFLLVTCKPIPFRELELDFFEDSFPTEDDCECPELENLINGFNEKLSKIEPLAFEPDNFRLVW